MQLSKFEIARLPVKWQFEIHNFNFLLTFPWSTQFRNSILLRPKFIDDARIWHVEIERQANRTVCKHIATKIVKSVVWKRKVCLCNSSVHSVVQNCIWCLWSGSHSGAHPHPTILTKRWTKKKEINKCTMYDKHLVSVATFPFILLYKHQPAI